MKTFQLTLQHVTYKCDTSQQSKDHQNWYVSAEINGLKVRIDIPIEEQASLPKVMLFIEAFHTAMSQAVADQKIGSLHLGKHNI